MCETSISFLDREERLPAATISAVLEMDRAADARRESETAASVVQGKIETRDFDVFLCHNSDDKPSVKQIGDQLKRYIDRKTLIGSSLPMFPSYVLDSVSSRRPSITLCPARVEERNLRKCIYRIYLLLTHVLHMDTTIRNIDPFVYKELKADEI